MGVADSDVEVLPLAVAGPGYVTWPPLATVNWPPSWRGGVDLRTEGDIAVIKEAREGLLDCSVAGSLEELASQEVASIGGDRDRV